MGGGRAAVAKAGCARGLGGASSTCSGTQFMTSCMQSSTRAMSQGYSKKPQPIKLHRSFHSFNLINPPMLLQAQYWAFPQEQRRTVHSKCIPARKTEGQWSKTGVGTGVSKDGTCTTSEMVAGFLRRATSSRWRHLRPLGSPTNKLSSGRATVRTFGILLPSGLTPYLPTTASAYSTYLAST